MDFEWDPVKAAANFTKHGIDFADAALMMLAVPGAVAWPVLLDWSSGFNEPSGSRVYCMVRSFARAVAVRVFGPPIHGLSGLPAQASEPYPGAGNGQKRP